LLFLKFKATLIIILSLIPFKYLLERAKIGRMRFCQKNKVEWHNKLLRVYRKKDK